MRFLVDINVGKLARLLRMMGYDALLFDHGDDNKLVAQALAEDRIVLTKDREILRRRVVTCGKLKALLIQSTDPDEQLKEVVRAFGLDASGSFTRCLECNSLLEPREKEEIKDRLPPYVYRSQEEFKECPFCHRLYWKGSHWQRMNRRLEKLNL